VVVMGFASGSRTPAGSIAKWTGVLLGALLLTTVTATAAPEESTLVYPPFGHCLGMHRATSFHLFLYLGTRTVFNEPAGLVAVKLDVNNDPETTSDDDELTVFGLNSGESEIIYNTSLYNVGIFGEPGDGPGRFRNPLGITADEKGNVFVADTGNNRIVRLVYRDAALHYVDSYGSRGSGVGELIGPSRVVLGASGKLYVTDTGNDRIVVMSPEGEWLDVIGDGDEAADGVTLERPAGLAVVEAEDPWISSHEDFLVVADRGGTRLLRLTMDGKIKSALEASSVPEPGAHFDYLAIDYYGNTYATDREKARIRKFDRDLSYVAGIGRPGTNDMELDQPRGITIYRRFGQVFITERAGAQYFWIGTDIQNARAEPGSLASGAKTRISYFLTEVSRVDLEVHDASGALLATLVSNRRRALGENSETWDGTLGKGTGRLAPGTYTLRIVARPTYSAGEYFHDTADVRIALR
jgi:sugar lactone lactonase YvrE